MTIKNSIVAGCSVAIAASLIGAPLQARETTSLPTDVSLVQLAFGEANLTGARTMPDEELGEARGGYGGVYFTLFGFGDINQVGGNLPDGVAITSQSAELVSLNLGLASLPNTGGFIQFASVVGNNNIVNNNLILNVYFLEGGVADTSTIATGGLLGL